MRKWLSYRNIVLFMIGALSMQFLIVKFAVIPPPSPEVNEKGWQIIPPSEALLIAKTAAPEELLNPWYFVLYGIALLAVTYVPNNRIGNHPFAREMRTGVAWILIVAWTVYSIAAISAIKIGATQQCGQFGLVAFFCKLTETSWLEYHFLFVGAAGTAVVQAFCVFKATARASGESWT